MLVTILASAAASTLPTACPTVVTGEELAAFRAEVVAPAVVAATSTLHTLRDDHGDAACPSADGSACTAGTGVGFAGTLTASASTDASQGFGHCLSTYRYAYADAGGLVAALPEAEVAADGRAAAVDIADGCDEAYGTAASWAGRLAVVGAHAGLADDALEGEAYARTLAYVGGGGTDYASWDGTSGACAWTASSLLTEGTACGALHREGAVTLGGVTVTYTWCADADGAALMSATFVDGVHTGPAHWAADGAYDVAAWIDADGDGWSVVGDCDDADPARTDDDGDCDGDGAHRADDCDDRDPAVRPRADELCGDGVDQDCDGVDDADCDGFDDDDCDDADPTVHPGATDAACDAIDQDCDGLVHDRDCDGYGADDCDDADPAVSPAAAEIACNGADENCDGWDDPDCDADGYVETDCAPDDDAVNPGAIDAACDGVDQDCDGVDLCPEPWRPGCGGGAALVVLAPLALRRRRTRARPL